MATPDALEKCKQQPSLTVFDLFSSLSPPMPLRTAQQAIPIAAQTFATIVIVYAAYKNLPAAAALRNLIVVDGILFMVAVDTIGLIQL